MAVSQRMLNSFLLLFSRCMLADFLRFLCLSACLSVYLSACLSGCLPTCLSASLSVCPVLSVCLSVCLCLFNLSLLLRLLFIGFVASYIIHKFQKLREVNGL